MSTASSSASLLGSEHKIQQWQENASREIEDEAGIVARLLRACLDSLSCLIQTLKSSSTPKHDQHILRRCHCILKLWADGHGVWVGRLDGILKRSRNLQRTTLSIINPMCKILLQALDKHVPSRDDDTVIAHLKVTTAQIHDQTKWLLAGDEGTSDGDDDSDSDSDSETLGDEVGSNAFTRLVENIKTYTDCLVDLSPALECPAIDPEHDDEPSVLRVEQRAAHEYHAELILAKYPNASFEMVDCLGKTSWARYQRMQQEREHNVHAYDYEQRSRIADSKSKFQDSGLGTSIPPANSAYAETVISFMTGVTGGKRVQIPSLPAEAKNGSPFECHACGRRIRATTNREWRKHLYLDLQPYSCFYTSCSFRATPFANHQLWSDHLELDHKLGPDWNSVECPLCLETTKNGKSALLVHFARHMEDIALAALPREVESDAESEGDYTYKSQSEVDLTQPPAHNTVQSLKLDNAKNVEWTPAIRDYVRRATDPANAVPGIAGSEVQTMAEYITRVQTQDVDWSTYPLPQELLQEGRRKSVIANTFSDRQPPSQADWVLTREMGPTLFETAQHVSEGSLNSDSGCEDREEIEGQSPITRSARQTQSALSSALQMEPDEVDFTPRPYIQHTSENRVASAHYDGHPNFTFVTESTPEAFKSKENMTKVRKAAMSDFFKEKTKHNTKSKIGKGKNSSVKHHHSSSHDQHTLPHQLVDDTDYAPLSAEAMADEMASDQATIGDSEIKPGVIDMDSDEFPIKCICGFLDDDGNTVLCENCDTWQHIICYYESAQHVPDIHDCTDCQPRPIDRELAAEKQRLQRRPWLKTAEKRDRSDKRPQTSHDSGISLNPAIEFQVKALKNQKRDNQLKEARETDEDDAIWDCADCGNGPMSLWQPACHNCHAKRSSASYIERR
ncbi:hypothetical protein P153DRAFT_384331 [Dothidotthia symphoricarpi CBS 119687]|uniref:Oxidoreductase acuF-like C2H2 type zinc-finger domain-containing protein n=1 Tax=Dothidotthia symphoricarpi CBS 119687 TaxID=1392245 RepID=A0A6A6AJR8_9PLEO|nr:uncharacterized protein P153DRAFT_384331 [Dothidotthia symphoricarpi CBS 119687]KAF2131117.1 hypothetical protein P153DRAFT_384331 [Dothidotthia symphoricarpi CBS 119687]